MKAMGKGPERKRADGFRGGRTVESRPCVPTEEGA